MPVVGCFHYFQRLLCIKRQVINVRKCQRNNLPADVEPVHYLDPALHVHKFREPLWLLSYQGRVFGKEIGIALRVSMVEYVY